ncbi:G/U mismatch-specific DNA glycosylase [Sporotomaculum syntrophicum]|uniref:G/U mismatch-specific DNA glycosylase n=1 Tax=Sporotomaculum syntrophicum TaxID=182264 RepID=A0A9D3AWP1_9FIRM|nr:G/U mismatch-specific DNA glycosylase [Sporotomaculum syntrophicum]KAF1085705.1 G/U mismatch-specific DNA glycosylase [Sporotomaculum syntrophicum]
MLKPLSDILEKGLKIIFVGYNPSLRSSETGHHFANPSNRFWNILYRAGLTPRKYSPEEDAGLLQLGYGITNIVSGPTRAAAEITTQEYQKGAVELRRKLAYYKPHVVCYVGKGVYEKYSGRRNVPWGKQKEPVVPGITDFVVPSSSGLVRMKLDDVVAIYSGLKELLRGRP